MSVKLTEQQRLAVNCRNGSLIVSAAAGAGKTAVLVQRVLGLLTDSQNPCGVDQLLVVTFTNAAAGEMRQRIGDELRRRLAETPDDRHLRRQLGLLGSARIQTVHAFCQSLIREHFALCDVEPDFRLADDTQCELLQEQALNDALEEAYAAAEPGFTSLCENLTDGRTDRQLTAAVLDMFNRLRSHPSPEFLLELLPRLCGREPDSLDWMRRLQTDARSRLNHARKSLEKTRELCASVPEVDAKYGPLLDHYLQFCTYLQQDMETGWNAARDRLDCFEKGRLPVCRYEDKDFLNRIKAGRERFVAAMQTLRQECYFRHWEAIAAEGQACAPMVEALCRLVSDFSQKYQAEKRRRGLLDFSDLEHCTLKLLEQADGSPTPLAQALQCELREVLVDEYQDTNEIQERIFRALRKSGDSAFFVGDVKQSIYRFRLAEPTIFLDRYKKSIAFTGVENGDLKLSLNRNFRSRPEVLALCNAVFSRLMTERFGDVDYDEEQRLYPGRTVENTVPSEVLLLDCPSDPTREEEEARTVLEARLVARRISRILREERVPEGETTRPARPEDVAVLLSSYTNKAPVFRAELQKLGIPCGESDGAFFGTVETAVMLSLLRLLQNRRQDIPLTSLLRSPLYLASPELLARLRLLAPKGDLIDGLEIAAQTEPLCAKVLEDLDRWSAEAMELPLSRLVRLIYDQTGAEGIFAALDNGLQRVNNLRRLEDMTRSFDMVSGGLYAFLRWIDRKLQDGEEPESEAGETQGVQLLSIHKSKGLEYPFVVVPDLSKRFNTDDLKKPVLFHPNIGVGLRLRQQETHGEYKTQLQQAIVLQTRQELRSEELRKLYVAMTRPREKLILVMSDKSLTKKVDKVAEETGGEPSPQWLAQQSDAMNWLLAALLTHPACTELRALCSEPPAVAEDSRKEDLICRVISVADLEEKAPAFHENDPESKENTPEEIAYGPLLARSRAIYPHLAASRLPSKLTPTGLKKLIPETGEVFGQPQKATVRDHHPQPLEKPDKKALLRGTAMHLLLSRADLTACTDRQAVLEQADRLQQQGYLSAEAREQVWPEPIVAFAASSLGRRAQQAERVMREYEFSVLLDAHDLLENGPEGEQILLNGAIDLLLFEGDGLTIVDFKTDRIRGGEEEVQAQEHRLQLKLYEQAAREIFGLPVKECWVWFLRTGTGIKL